MLRILENKETNVDMRHIETSKYLSISNLDYFPLCFRYHILLLICSSTLCFATYLLYLFFTFL